MKSNTAAFAAAAIIAGVAGAGVQYQASGGLSGSVAVFDFTDNGSGSAFANGNNRFNSTILRSIHNELNAAGIVTNDVLTFVAGETSDGIAMFALFDQETSNSFVELRTSAEFDFTGVGTAYQNEGGEIGNGATAFRWDNNTKGDAFAVTGLTNDFADNAFTIGNFTDLGNGGINGAVAQVVVENADGSFSTVTLTDFFGNGGNFAFAVPVPAAGALAGVGLLGVAVRRRR